jgi:hypothetical protein
MADLEIASALSGSVGSSLSGTVGTTVSGSMGSIGPVTLAGIPDAYTIKVTELAKVNIGIDPLESTVTLKPVRVDFGPIDTRISIKEIPSTRTHLPLNYCVGLSVFGVELAAIRLCGEGMVITEPYRPSPCEVCGTLERQAADAQTTATVARAK